MVAGLIFAAGMCAGELTAPPPKAEPWLQGLLEAAPSMRIGTLTNILISGDRAAINIAVNQ